MIENFRKPYLKPYRLIRKMSLRVFEYQVVSSLGQISFKKLLSLRLKVLTRYSCLNVFGHLYVILLYHRGGCSMNIKHSTHKNAREKQTQTNTRRRTYTRHTLPEAKVHILLNTNRNLSHSV